MKAKDLIEKALSSEERDDLPKKDFAIPSKEPESGSYPIPDESHARNALARVSQHGTPEEKAKVRAAVKRKFPSIDVEESLSSSVFSQLLGEDIENPPIPPEGGARQHYEHLMPIVEEIADATCDSINSYVSESGSQPRYAQQWMLEEVIKILESRV